MNWNKSEAVTLCKLTVGAIRPPNRIIPDMNDKLVR